MIHKIAPGLFIILPLMVVSAAPGEDKENLEILLAWTGPGRLKLQCCVRGYLPTGQRFPQLPGTVPDFGRKSRTM